MRKRALVILAGALALAGCDNRSPATSTVRSGSTETAARSSNVEQQRELSVTKESTVTVEVPLLPLMWRALGAGYQMPHPGALPPSDVISVAGPACGLANLQNDDESAWLQVDQLIENSPGVDWLKPLFYHEDGTRRERLRMGRLCAHIMINTTLTAPVGGWANGRNPDAAKAEMKWTIDMLHPAVEFLDAVARRVSSLPASDEDRLVDQIREEMELAGGFAETMQYYMMDSSPRSYTQDRAGKHPSPVHYFVSMSTGNWDVSQDGSGTRAIQNGTTVFGDGYINGKRYTAEVTETRRAGMTRSRESGSSYSTDIDSGVRGQAGTQ